MWNSSGARGGCFGRVGQEKAGFGGDTLTCAGIWGLGLCCLSGVLYGVGVRMYNTVNNSK